ncbi:hypothetical protein [Nostoc sp. LPT]|uniref:hypothetical protein n=1 Tax=Nostoc sp. LPT TaxID=2815387 RepID=UPI0025FAF395|nr:hypothetical protein [Nostoc sp. LPT]
MGQTFERFEPVGDKVHVYFTGGLAEVGDVLIGADGLRSKVRSRPWGALKS